VDGMVIGVWVALVHFHLLTSAIMLMVLVHCTYAMQSVRHAMLAVVGAIAGWPSPVCSPRSRSSTTPAPTPLSAACWRRPVFGHARHCHRPLAAQPGPQRTDADGDAPRRCDDRLFWPHVLAGSGDPLFAYAKQKDIPAFLIVVDVDNFRELNSRHGETAGDEVIIAVANTLRTCVRPGDATCRFGGDSFAVLLSGVNLDIANQIADRIHKPGAQPPSARLARCADQRQHRHCQPGQVPPVRWTTGLCRPKRHWNRPGAPRACTAAMPSWNRLGGAPGRAGQLARPWSSRRRLTAALIP
ncbi:GGDEF domain-containing protein, partial [Comamonas sp. JC664]|uniref:GGDEF domain-containing protein n=1 Tax=Comamonas sp. JC664 TaxID=2801917 RepID=UPI0036207E7B